ncbi:MAG: hypothetical protein B6D61_04415 [Bacteroidetes bacterium 4484_249]|nr:MAG: hypothetical protein B6D61_04415 [Bacteroidetes bacterium 4484_249]
MEIPFNFGKIVKTSQFINREREINNLKLNFKSHINTVLISPRRWGKSSLVNEVSLQIQKSNKDIRFCFIDLFAVRDEEEFYQIFATEVIKATSNKWQEWAENGKKLISKIIPRFQIGIDPVNDFKISFDWKELKQNSKEILDLPEKVSNDKNIHLIVCIDEFQNIAHFEDPLIMQKKMRSVWQKHQISTYCLYGSKRHMLSKIFENKSMPFYKFGDTIFLEKINHEHWVKFICRQFGQTNKKISTKQASEIAGRMENHPYFVQLFAATVWKLTGTKCTVNIIDKALDSLIEQYSLMFQRETDKFTNKQLNFLKALAENVEKFSSKEALTNYNLGSQGNVNKIKVALENKEVIDLWGNKIEFIDPLFRLWFIKVYLERKF